MKSGDQELGTVIECCEWVEGTEIGDWISELGWDLTPSLYPWRTPQRSMSKSDTYKTLTNISPFPSETRCP